MIPIDEFEYEVVHKIFQRILPFSGADALMPINPRHWAKHIGGSILSSDLSTSVDVISKPIENLVVAKNYMINGHR